MLLPASRNLLQGPHWTAQKGGEGRCRGARRQGLFLMCLGHDIPRLPPPLTTSLGVCWETRSVIRYTKGQHVIELQRERLGDPSKWLHYRHHMRVIHSYFLNWVAKLLQCKYITFVRKVAKQSKKMQSLCECDLLTNNLKIKIRTEKNLER